MAKEKMLWSLNGKSSVRASKLRSFTILEWNTFEGNQYRLVGMFNSKDDFEFGIFDTEKQAKTFLNGIHKKIEGSNGR